MSLASVQAKEIPGTRVLLVKKNRENPARKKADRALFEPGYWEIHVASSGQHPDFAKGWWKILLVTISRPTIEFEILKDTGLSFVPVSPYARPLSIEIKVEQIELDGVRWQFPSFIITLSDNTQVKIQCDDPQQVSLAIN